MAIKEIPTGILPEEIVETLPKIGEENKVYRRLVEDEELREMQITDDFIWYDDEWHEFSFDVRIFGAYFSRFQQGVMETIAELESRIEVLEHEDNILFCGTDIELTEMGATRGKWIDVQTNIKVSDGTIFDIELKNMTIDGKPIEDYTGTSAAYGVPNWNWCGCDFYDVQFGNGAYFSFGTESKDNVVNKVTLGFVNEGDGFDVRTLKIGEIIVKTKEKEEVA